MNCPRCNFFNAGWSPINIWKGCQRCRFLQKEYRDACQPFGQFDWDLYKVGVLKAFEDLEVDRLIDGI